MKSKRITISRKGLLWYDTGHSWIYRDDLLKTYSAAPGDVVDILDGRGRFLGRGFYGDKSKIAIRILTRKDEAIDDAFFKTRIEKAILRRGERSRGKGAARLVFSEGDSLPGLIVDRYAGWLVFQTLIPGMDRLLDRLAGVFGELLSPAGIVCRNDAGSRAIEGLPLRKKTMSGEKPGLVEVEEGEIRYLADIWDGHKTGAYLDQAENRAMVAAYSTGRVLDCFSYQGHFALRCAGRAEHVTAVESSPDALALLEKNVALNGAGNITPAGENVFDLLRSYHREKKKFDLIILDPPPLARKKTHAGGALRGYKELNLRAMHLLNPGGVLATFSCSHSISVDLFSEMLRMAATDARCEFRVLTGMRQGSDHPVLINTPETFYLKGFLLQKN